MSDAAANIGSAIETALRGWCSNEHFAKPAWLELRRLQDAALVLAHESKVDHRYVYRIIKGGWRLIDMKNPIERVGEDGETGIDYPVVAWGSLLDGLPLLTEGARRALGEA